MQEQMSDKYQRSICQINLEARSIRIEAPTPVVVDRQRSTRTSPLLALCLPCHTLLPSLPPLLFVSCSLGTVSRHASYRSQPPYARLVCCLLGPRGSRLSQIIDHLLLHSFHINGQLRMLTAPKGMIHDVRLSAAVCWHDNLPSPLLPSHGSGI
jgi:hypothetical protein